jgi:hypothetical protein
MRRSSESISVAPAQKEGQNQAIAKSRQPERRDNQPRRRGRLDKINVNRPLI